MTFEFKDLPVDTYFQPVPRAGIKMRHRNGVAPFVHPCFKKIDDVTALRIENFENNDEEVMFYANDKIAFSSLPLDGEGNLVKVGDPVVFNRYNRIYDGVVIAICKRTNNSIAYDLRNVRNNILNNYEMDYQWRNQTIFVPKLKVQSPGLKKPMLITYPRRLRKGMITL